MMRYATNAENERITAEHESAHSLAYDVHGLDFASIDAQNALTGPETPRRIYGLTFARVSLAGAVVDALFTDDLPHMMRFWLECAEHQGGEDNDITSAPPEYFFDGLVWAFAFVETNAELIAEVADAVGAAGGALSYAEFAPYRGRAVDPPIEVRGVWGQRLMGEHGERVLAIIRALFTRRGA